MFAAADVVKNGSTALQIVVSNCHDALRTVEINIPKNIARKPKASPGLARIDKHSYELHERTSCRLATLFVRFDAYKVNGSFQLKAFSIKETVLRMYGLAIDNP